MVMDSALESPVPVRFVFVLVGPGQSDFNYGEIGRAMGALMADWVRKHHTTKPQKPAASGPCCSIQRLRPGLLLGGLPGPDRHGRDQRHRRLHGLQHCDPAH